MQKRAKSARSPRAGIRLAIWLLSLTLSGGPDKGAEIGVRCVGGVISADRVAPESAQQRARGPAGRVMRPAAGESTGAARSRAHRTVDRLYFRSGAGGEAQGLRRDAKTLTSGDQP